MSKKVLKEIRELSVMKSYILSVAQMTGEDKMVVLERMKNHLLQMQTACERDLTKARKRHSQILVTKRQEHFH